MAVVAVRVRLPDVAGRHSGLINERLWISEPLACMLLGIALGPAGLNLLRLDVAHNPDGAAALREVARVTLAIAVAGAAMRLPARWIRHNWRGLLVALGPGMVLMWVVASGVTWATLGAPLLTAVVIGAAISPTDPVLSSPILTGRLAQRVVPAELRHALTTESAVNDGVALPLVMLPILLLKYQPARAGGEWLVNVVAWQIGAAVVVGTAAGWLASRCLCWARRRPDAVSASLLAVTLALALAVLAALRTLEADGIFGSLCGRRLVEQRQS
ncbi:MAG: cation:proton antiporter [Rhodopila sp.]